MSMVPKVFESLELDCIRMDKLSDILFQRTSFKSLQQENIITVDSRYLEFQGTLLNTSRYPYFDISDLQNWGKTNSINHI